MGKIRKVTSVESPERRRKGIYILPNLFTTAGLFAAFYAIIQSTVGSFENAAIAILIAAILDSLDGRVARMTNTVSDFGKQYDSLVDLVAFGLTPALVLFEWTLKDAGKIGWLTAFFFVAATALRLARFNTQDSSSSRYFQGLPCPAAAVLVATAIWALSSYQLRGTAVTAACLVMMAVLSLAMVSSLPYRSFKDLDLKHRVPFMALLVLVFVFVLVSFDPPWVLFLTSIAYVLWGPVIWISAKWSNRNIFSDAPVSGEVPVAKKADQNRTG